ncbi:MAG: hypothetical protein KAJ44_02890 [Thermoplasmatales archaeon]|nr:hypothetical protein [Thermoplasmatales archaeon]
MQNKYIKKVVAFSIVVILLMIAMVPAFGSVIVKTTNDGIEISNDLTKVSTDRGWYWKPPYPNYAPHTPGGMPDFDQKQDRWKSISDGGNGIADTNATGDDVQLIPVGGAVNPGDIIVAPGPNCQLDTNVSGDDVEEWAFCGPVAIANCFWWFDSKFANPDGTPGDGIDEFSLVENYGVADDHSSDNVPLLIEKLARAMNTTDKGTTYISDMQNAVNEWFTDTGLADWFEETTYNMPTFEFIEGEIERSQDVILLLGFYDYVIGDKVVDQSQPVGLYNDWLQTSTWWDYQSFVPTVNRLDAIKILLVSNNPDDCEIEINVYDTQGGLPIGTATLNPGYLAAPTWIQFHFEPSVDLNPYDTYYFDVRQLEDGFHYEWFFMSPDPYAAGTGWMNQVPNDPYGNPFDWTFETEHYDPPPGSVRRGAHYVTCAGVNSEEFKIAFSDPRYNVSNPSGGDHNDAQNVSHDTYNVNTTCPCPDLEYEWWLPDYHSGYDYTIVEQAVVICPLPDEEPPIVEITKPGSAIYFLNIEIFPFFLPFIIGPIDIEVTASDNREIESVEFKINDISQWTDTTEPYIWTWEEGVFFIQNIEVVAVDGSGNHGYDTRTVLKFF